MTPTVEILIKPSPIVTVSQCQSRIIFGDDNGDNSCTFRCERGEGHTGLHRETGSMYGQPYILRWGGDVKDWDKKQMEAELGTKDR